MIFVLRAPENVDLLDTAGGGIRQSSPLRRALLAVFMLVQGGGVQAPCLLLVLGHRQVSWSLLLHVRLRLPMLGGLCTCACLSSLTPTTHLLLLKPENLSGRARAYASLH